MKTSKENPPEAHPGIAGRIARTFIDSKLTLLIVIASLLLGVFAVVMLPREEEPQIKVPMVDVLVTMPGSGAKEVEERVTRPMEKLLWEIPGVEYIYSTSSEGQSLVIVRFKVGEDMDSSLVKLNQKLQSNYDKIPHGVSQPLIKAWSIDDVPILCLTFHSRALRSSHVAAAGRAGGRRGEAGSAGRRDDHHWRRAPASARAARPGEARGAQSFAGRACADDPAGE